jgi:ABC-type antimicrobial peptide transport system permease subunit
MINETMAKTYWPGISALGKCLVLVGTDQCRQVVGIVADARQSDLREESRAQLYAFDLGNPALARLPRTLAIRADDPIRLIPTIRQSILSREPALPYLQIQPLEALIEPKLRPWTLGATMFTLFGALALTLAVVGLYGSLSSAVAERTHEIGVRLALGASPRRIWLLTARWVSFVVVGGLALGLLALRWAAPTLESLLFGIHTLDARIIAGALGIMAVSSAAACYPAIARATRVDPIRVLRET